MTKPIPPSPTGNLQHPAPHTAPSAPKKNQAILKLLGIVLLIIIVLGGGIWLYKHNKNKDKENTDNVADIQQSFEPPTTTPPTTEPTNIITNSATTTSTSNLYTNPDLGFQIELNPNWYVKPYSNSEVILADENGAQFTVEAINNAGADLNTVKNQLEHSSSVKSLTSTQFQNQPALSFNTSNGQQGYALIYKTYLYYIIGHLKNAPLSTFQFLGSNGGAPTTPRNSL